MNIVLRIARQLTPPIITRIAKKLAGITPPPPRPEYQGVTTPHNMQAMHEGRFAEIFEHWAKIDPYHRADVVRLRTYMVCLFAHMAKDLPGDFVTAGVSYGVAPRVVFDVVGPKRLHLIDSFEGAGAHGTVVTYNTDADFVRNQYPAGADIDIHKNLIPDCLPLGCPLAFVHVNTGNCKAEADSLALFWRDLVPGGIILIDNYAIDSGHQAEFAEALKALHTEIYTLVSGQGVVIKPR